MVTQRKGSLGGASSWGARCSPGIPLRHPGNGRADVHHLVDEALKAQGTIAPLWEERSATQGEFDAPLHVAQSGNGARGRQTRKACVDFEQPNSFFS
jgi:hypothetical protein